MMQMSSVSVTWELVFAAGHVVPPCKGLDPATINASVVGSPISPETIPTQFFLPLFVESADACRIEVAFAPAPDGSQHNFVRSIVRSMAIDDAEAKARAARELALRLASVTTKRSPVGLFVVLVGRRAERTRVVLWKFPADESLQADVSRQEMSIRLIQDAFSRKSSYFKAAVFEDGPAFTGFWKGRVEDRQIKHGVKDAAQFWIADFLDARTALTPARGTRILATALRDTIQQTSSVEMKETLIAAATVIKTQVDRLISLDEFAVAYLPEATRPTFLKAVGDPNLARAMFSIDSAVLDTELKFRSLILDRDFTVRGPLDRFDDVVKVRSTDHDPIVEVSLRGTITSHAVRR